MRLRYTILYTISLPRPQVAPTLPVALKMREHFLAVCIDLLTNVLLLHALQQYWMFIGYYDNNICITLISDATNFITLFIQ
jgi:hypothetical protein